MSDRLLVMNRNGGSADHGSVPEAIELLRAAGTLEVAETDSPGEVEEVLAATRAPVVVVGGGDGAIHIAAGALHRLGRLSDVLLGVLPLGTGNDLARSLGIPLDPPEAAGVVVEGAERLIDVMIDGAGEVAVNAAHIGVGAEAARISSGLKDVLGPLAYPAGASVAGVREEGWRLSVTVDGRRLTEGALLMVGVGNGSTIGGGTVLFPDARLDDGALEVVAVAAVERLSRAGLAADLRRGQLHERDDVVAARGATVVVEGDAFRVDIDGEVSDLRTRVEYRVEPTALHVLAPRT